MIKHVLALVDVQNIYYGSLNYTDGAQQVDYAALMPFLTEEMVKYYRLILPEMARPYVEVSIDFTAYVVQTPRYNGAAFFAFLRSLGYALKSRSFSEESFMFDPDETESEWRGSVGSSIQMDMLDQGPDYDGVLVLSGSGVFEKVFRAMEGRWPHVTRVIAAFDNTLHHTYTSSSGLVNHIIHLDERVLRDKHGR